MLCCLGLFTGFYVGSLLGGPWVFIAPGVGFVLGFLGDMKLMRKDTKHRGLAGDCCGGGMLE